MAGRIALSEGKRRAVFRGARSETDTREGNKKIDVFVTACIVKKHTAVVSSKTVSKKVSI